MRGVASWRWVRPILTMSSKSRAFDASTAAQPGEGGKQAFAHLYGGGNVDGAREHVVGRLRAVDVIVGVHATIGSQRLSHQLRRPVGDHFVEVHVALGATAGLPDHEGEVLVKASVDDLLGGLLYRLGDICREIPELPVDLGRALLDERERPYQRSWQAFLPDREVLEGSLGLGAPVAIRRHGNFAHAVPFGGACSWLQPARQHR